MKNLALVAVAAVATLGTTTVSAATIFDSGTPSGPAGYSIFNIGSDAYQGEAGSFTLSQTSRITGVEGYFGASAPGSDRLVLGIHADQTGVPGQPFGPAIAERIVTIPSNDWNFFGWVGAFGDGSLVLPAGTYWATFTADPNDPARCNCWMPANQSVTIPVGAYTNNFTGQNWIVRELYFGMRVFGDATGTAGAVPEPESWALMVLGFGTLGAAMRRGRRTARAVAYA